MGVNPAGSFKETCGYAEVPDPSFPGELKVHLSPYRPAGDYWLLDTDYENFASVYSCTDIFGIIKIVEVASVLVRDTNNVTSEVMNKALDAFENQNLSTEAFVPVSHEGCTYEDPGGVEPCTGGDIGK